MKTTKTLYLYLGIAGTLLPLQAAAQEKPNILFILADDLGIGDITPYGQQLIRTPNLQRLANQGLVFTQAYAGSTVSAPSRCSLMTGLNTSHTAIRGNVRVEPEGQAPMPAGTYTVAKLLQEAGYATGCFGKWGLGYPGSVSTPEKMGFNEFFGYNCQTRAHDYYPDHLWDGTERIELPGNYEQQEAVYSGDLIHGKALDFIRANAGAPFFAYLSYTLPHAELRLPEDSVFDYYCTLIPKSDEKPYSEADPFRVGAYGAQQRPLAAFASMVERLDSYVGEIMNLLQELGIADNTLLVFTSDNGPHREGGADPSYFKSSGPFRGIKRDLYEGGIRVPMIVRYPGHTPAGASTDLMIAFWDMLPTFAEFAGVPVPVPTDGISFAPLLKKKSRGAGRRIFYWELHEGGGKQAVRQGRWKAIRLNVNYPDRATFELYDLSKDIHEDRNVAERHPVKARKLLRIMEEANFKSQ
ncbi:MAG: arylsulfatase [Candidatus Cryptobacteroides sp.]|jgi:arylsulfatase A